MFYSVFKETSLFLSTLYLALALFSFSSASLYCESSANVSANVSLYLSDYFYQKYSSYIPIICSGSGSVSYACNGKLFYCNDNSTVSDIKYVVSSYDSDFSQYKVCVYDVFVSSVQDFIDFLNFCGDYTTQLVKSYPNYNNNNNNNFTNVDNSNTNTSPVSDSGYKPAPYSSGSGSGSTGSTGSTGVPAGLDYGIGQANVFLSEINNELQSLHTDYINYTNSVISSISSSSTNITNNLVSWSNIINNSLNNINGNITNQTYALQNTFNYWGNQLLSPLNSIKLQNNSIITNTANIDNKLNTVNTRLSSISSTLDTVDQDIYDSLYTDSYQSQYDNVLNDVSSKSDLSNFDTTIDNIPDKTSISDIISGFLSNSPVANVFQNARIEAVSGVCSVNVPFSIGGFSRDGSIDFCQFSDILSTVGSFILIGSYILSFYIVFRKA